MDKQTTDGYFDISLIVKQCPDGTKFYSACHGFDVKFDKTATDQSTIIVCRDPLGNSVTFFNNGASEPCGEMMLFPSCELRDWTEFARSLHNCDEFELGDRVEILTSVGYAEEDNRYGTIVYKCQGRPFPTYIVGTVNRTVQVPAFQLKRLTNK